MHDGQRVALNTVVMIAKHAIMAVLSIVFVGYLARRVGVADWGEFQAAIALTSMVMVVAGIGVRGYLAREIAVDPALGPTHLGAALAIRGVTGLVLLGATVLVATATAGPAARVLIALAALSQLAAILYTTMWLSFEAHERFQYILYAELAARLLVIGLASALLFAGYGVIAAASAFTLGSLFELAMTYVLLRKNFYAPRLTAGARELARIAWKSIPIGLLGAVTEALLKTDRVMLRFLVDESAVGIYSAAAVLSENCNMLADLFLGAAFAATVRLYATDQERFRALFQNCLFVAFALGLPIAAGVFIVAPDAIELVYGRDYGYSAASSVLRVLALQLPLMFTFHVTVLPLIAQRRELMLAKLLGAALVAKIALGVALVPRFGAMGAALTTLAVTALALAVTLGLSRAHMKGLQSRRLLSVVGATAGMAAAAWAAKQVAGMWAGIAVGALAYAPLLLILGGTSREELASLLRRRAPVEDAPALP